MKFSYNTNDHNDEVDAVMVSEYCFNLNFNTEILILYVNNPFIYLVLTRLVRSKIVLKRALTLSLICDDMPDGYRE